jgi:hypothetical protein
MRRPSSNDAHHNTIQHPIAATTTINPRRKLALSAGSGAIGLRPHVGGGYRQDLGISASSFACSSVCARRRLLPPSREGPLRGFILSAAWVLWPVIEWVGWAGLTDSLDGACRLNCLEMPVAIGSCGSILPSIRPNGACCGTPPDELPGPPKIPKNRPGA